MIPFRTFTAILVGANLFLAGCAGLFKPATEPVSLVPRDQALVDYAAGLLADDRGDQMQAVAYYRRVLAQTPDSLVVRRLLIGSLVRLGRAREAIVEFQPILDRGLADSGFTYLLGELYEAVGDTATAETTYRRLIARDRKHSDPLRALGLLQLRAGQAGEGERLLQEALAIAPGDREARRSLVKFYLSREQVETAERLLHQGLEKDASDEEWLSYLARILSSRGEAKAASDLHLQVLRANPNNLDSRQALAEYYLGQHRWQDAASQLEWLVKAGPKQEPHLMRNLGLAYYELGRYEEARDQIQPLIEQGNADALTHFLMGSLYRQKRLWRLAAQEFEAAAQQNSDLPDAEVELAGVLAELGEDARAEAALERALEKAGRSSSSLFRCGLIFMRLKQWSRGRDVFGQALVLDPNNAQIHFHLGRAYLETGDFARAVSNWEKAIELDPKLSEAYNYLGYLHAERGLALEQAVRWLRRALDLEPQNGNYHDSLGWAYFKQHRYPEALRELQAALELFRAQGEAVDPVLFDHLGEVYLKLGRTADAATAWRQALQDDPTNLDIRGKLDKLVTGTNREKSLEKQE